MAAMPVTSITILVAQSTVPSADREDGQVAAGQLRNGAFIHFLVALILDGDREEFAVLALGKRIGLAAEIACRCDCLLGEIDDGKVSGRICLALGRHDADQRKVAGTTVEVGSPSTSTVPAGFGILGSVMSMMPMLRPGLSV